MSELFERFAGFREFVDPRQDQLADVYRALFELQNVNTEDPDEILRVIAGLDVQRIHRMYQNKCNEIQRGNSNLNWALSNVSFRNCKAVMGDNDYV